MEYSDLEFTVLGWVVGNFNVDCSFLFFLVVDDFAAHAVSWSGMLEKWIYIESTVTDKIFSLIEISN